MAGKPSVGYSSRFHTALLFLIFAFSGASSLIYEVVWKRWLADLLGSSSSATAMVLAVFMAGLGIGSLLAARVTDRIKRPVRIYAFLEFGIVLLAMLPSLEVKALSPFFVWIAASWGPESVFLDFARFGAVLLAIGPPSILMGATFPMIVRALGTRQENLGKQTAAAYAVNSLGGAFGTLLAGFVLIELMGLRGAIFCAAGLGCLAAVSALWVDRRTEKSIERNSEVSSSTGKPSNGKKSRKRKKNTEPVFIIPENPSFSIADNLRKSQPFWILFAAGIAGFCALGYETLWVRVLSLMTLNTTYAFSLMLSILLLGLSVGSWVVRWKLERWNRPVELFVLFQSFLSLYAWSSLLWLPRYAERVGQFSFQESWIGVPAVLAFGLLFLPACLMGASLPIACQLYGALTGGIGRPVGRIYASNTLGSVLGAVVIGLLIAPKWGTWWGIVCCSLIGALSAGGMLVVYLPKHRRFLFALPVIGATVSVLFVGVFRGGSSVSEQKLMPHGIVIYQAEDSGGLVEVLEDPNLGSRWLLTNRLHWEGSSVPAAVTGQRQEAILPLLLHPSPERVLEIGLGTGIKLSTLDSPLVRRAVVVEISSAVIEASNYFRDYSHGITGTKFAHSNIEVICADGRNYIEMTPDKFDIIVNGLLTPYRSGVARLYTVEHFRACRKKLDSDGMFVTWVAIRQIAPDDFKTLIASVLEVFPNTSLWLKEHYIALLSTIQPFEIESENLEKRFKDKQLQKMIDEAGLESSASLLAGFVAGPEKLRQFSDGFPLNTDDRPLIEFHTPKLGKRLNSNSLGAETIAQLWSLKEPINRFLVKADSSFIMRVTRAEKARSFSIEAFLRMCHGDHIEAAELFQKAIEIDPEDLIARSGMESYLITHGWQCLERGLTNQAHRVFQKALEINPRSIAALASLAALEEVAGNKKGAESFWNLVRKVDPNYRPAYRKLALDTDNFSRRR